MAKQETNINQALALLNNKNSSHQIKLLPQNGANREIILNDSCHKNQFIISSSVKE